MGLVAVVLTGELLLLVVFLLPIGDLLREAGQRVLHLPLPFPLTERILLDLYLAGGCYLFIASLGVPIFDGPLIFTVLVGGILGWGTLFWLQGSSSSTSKWQSSFGRTIRKGVHDYGFLAALGIGLLFFEVSVMGQAQLPDTFDGSIQVLFVVQLRHLRTLPWTLEPYAPFGVVYPQGTAVWMDVAGVILSWPTSKLPVDLSPLFASMAPWAAFVWIRRVLDESRPVAIRAGLLFAAAFTLVATWPRFQVGGSYDFLLATPLFFLLLGWGDKLTRPSTRLTFSYLLAYGSLLAILASLSVVTAQVLLALMLAFGLYRRRDSMRAAWKWVGSVAILSAFSLVLVLRSLVGLAVWWTYPAHVMTATGGPLLPTPPGPSPWLQFIGLADPFLFRPQDVWLSPFPMVRALIIAWLILGVVVASLWGIRAVPRMLRRVPDALIAHLVGGLLVGIGLLGFLTILEVGTGSDILFGTNLGEISILLFDFYTGLATLPMLLGLETLIHASNTQRQWSVVRWRKTRFHKLVQPLAISVALILLVAPLATGLVATATEAPPFLGEIIHDLSNTTVGDEEGLRWARELPECSGVLVAPGSVGEFLPAYVTLRLIFPMSPAPQNLSYQRSVQDLAHGQYTSTTRADLVALGVTEVFVTGQNNVLFPQLQPRPMENSSDFHLLFHDDDAYWFEFLPGVSLEGCAP